MVFAFDLTPVQPAAAVRLPDPDRQHRRASWRRVRCRRRSRSATRSSTGRGPAPPRSGSRRRTATRSISAGGRRQTRAGRRRDRSTPASAGETAARGRLRRYRPGRATTQSPRSTQRGADSAAAPSSSTPGTRASRTCDESRASGYARRYSTSTESGSSRANLTDFWPLLATIALVLLALEWIVAMLPRRAVRLPASAQVQLVATGPGRHPTRRSPDRLRSGTARGGVAQCSNCPPRPVVSSIAPSGKLVGRHGSHLRPTKCALATARCWSLFAVLGWTIGVHRRRLARSVIVLRLLIVTLLIFGVAEPMLATGADASSTVFLVDRSTSLTDATSAAASSG